jgi:hypothetical protein
MIRPVRADWAARLAPQALGCWRARIVDMLAKRRACCRDDPPDP